MLRDIVINKCKDICKKYFDDNYSFHEFFRGPTDTTPFFYFIHKNKISGFNYNDRAIEFDFYSIESNYVTIYTKNIEYTNKISTKLSFSDPNLFNTIEKIIIDLISSGA